MYGNYCGESEVHRGRQHGRWRYGTKDTTANEDDDAEKR